jgi:ribosome-binding factor A
VSSHTSRRSGHRTARLEHVVAELLECDLLPSLEDPLLQNLHVLRVEVKNLACIRATLRMEPGETDVNAVQAALSRVEGRMRAEIAQQLRLKRMPELRLACIALPEDFHAKREIGPAGPGGANA